jgi:hypothetical protein
MAEGLGLGDERAGNIAEPDQAQHLPGEAAQRRHRRHLPAARLHQLVRKRNFAREREQQRHGVVRHFMHAIVGHVCDHDTELGRRLGVDIVDAEAEPADRLAALQLPQQLARQLGIGDQDRIRIARHRQDVLGRHALRHAHFGIEARQRGQGGVKRGEDTVGHGDDGSGHGVLQSTTTLLHCRIFGRKTGGHFS